MRHFGYLTLGLAALFTGCDLVTVKTKPATPAPVTSSSPATGMPGTTGLMPPGDMNDLGAPVAGAPTGGAPAIGPGGPVVPGGQPVEQEVAGVGSGIKGRSLDSPDVVQAIAQPAKSYFATKERVVFEIQIPHALNLYKATEGTAPASHEEFMEKIVAANQIPLPALPPGHRYVYDPTTEQLMVEKPAKN